MSIHKVNSVITLKDGTVLAIRPNLCLTVGCYFLSKEHECLAKASMFNKKDIHVTTNGMFSCAMTIDSDTHFEKIDGGV